MAKKVNQTVVPQEVEQVVEVQEQEQEQQEVEQVVKTQKDVIKQLIAAGATRITNVKVRNASVTKKDSYVQVALTLINPIPGYISKDNGITFEKGMTNFVFTSSYAIAGCLRENEEYAWLAGHIVERPSSLELILSGATIDIVQQEIIAGEEYQNPFSTRIDTEVRVYDHNVVINNIIDVKLSKIGEKAADRIMDNILDGKYE